MMVCSDNASLAQAQLVLAHSGGVLRYLNVYHPYRQQCWWRVVAWMLTSTALRYCKPCYHRWTYGQHVNRRQIANEHNGCIKEIYRCHQRLSFEEGYKHAQWLKRASVLHSNYGPWPLWKTRTWVEGGNYPLISILQRKLMSIYAFEGLILVASSSLCSSSAVIGDDYRYGCLYQSICITQRIMGIWLLKQTLTFRLYHTLCKYGYHC